MSSRYRKNDVIWDEKRRRDGLKTAFLRCGRPFPAAQTVRFRSVKGRLPPCKRLHSAKQTPWIRPERGVNMGVKPQADAIWRKTFVISFYFRPSCGCSFPPQQQPFRRAAAARPSILRRCSRTARLTQRLSQAWYIQGNTQQPASSRRSQRREYR